MESWAFNASSSHNIQTDGCEQRGERAGISKTGGKAVTEMPTKGSRGSTEGKGILTYSRAAFSYTKTMYSYLPKDSQQQF